MKSKCFTKYENPAIMLLLPRSAEAVYFEPEEFAQRFIMIKDVEIQEIPIIKETGFTAMRY